MQKWKKFWLTDRYLQAKQINFELVDNYIDFQPKTILDIGCGFARESQLFQEKYSSNLFLLDGNYNQSTDKNRDISYGPSDNFMFYNHVNELKYHWDSQNMKYTFVNGNDPFIRNSVKFDLIYSFLSCGFHYPASTYKDLILKHSTPDTVIIMDIRHIKRQRDIEIVDIVAKDRKSQKLKIKFLAQ